MNRINVSGVDNTGNSSEFIGWFDIDSAEVVAEFKEGDCYRRGKILYVTASGKLVVNKWTNTGSDYYRYVTGEQEIAEILCKGEYSGDNSYMLKTLKMYEL